MGRFGLTSLGHGAFTGIGAYATVLLWNFGGITPWIGIPVGIVMATIVGILIGYPCFRFRIAGHYFALLTLALTEFVRLCIVGLRDYTGGSLGTQPARAGDGISLVALQFEPNRTLAFYIAFALWVLGLYVWLRVDASMDRYALDAASQDEDAAASVGIDVTRERLKITALSSAMSALGGAIFAQYQMYISPDTIAGLGAVAQHGVRGHCRRHLGAAGAHRRRRVHAGACRGPARHHPGFGDTQEPARQLCAGARPADLRPAARSCSSSTCRAASSAPRRPGGAAGAASSRPDHAAPKVFAYCSGLKPTSSRPPTSSTGRLIIDGCSSISAIAFFSVTPA